LDQLKAASTVYRHVTVIGVNTTDLYFTHDDGIANVKLRLLDPALQKRFHYDPQAAAELERNQEKADALYHESLAVEIMARAEKASVAAKKAATTSESSLADAISDRSLLGRAAPSIEVEKWLGDKPVTDGKFVLVSIWAPWSVPSRRFIPMLNALQRKFSSALVVVGVTADSEAEVSQMIDPRIEFPSAIDSKARLANACGATSVPYVILIDNKKIVRYQGHPAALDERRLQALMGGPAE
jgi:thiol-disulfide isomerase/thioredoxin